MRVVGIVVPFVPQGSVLGENSFYRATGCKWAQATCAMCPQQRYATGELKPGKVQGVGIVEGDLCRVPPAAVRHGRAS